MTIDQNVYTFNTICLYVQSAKDGSLQYILEFTEPGAVAKSPFADVATTAWYYKDVLAASRTKILTGTSDTAFSPDAVMSGDISGFALTLGEALGVASLLFL